MAWLTKKGENQVHRAGVFQIGKVQWRVIIGVIALICSACFAPSSTDAPGRAETAPEVDSYAPDFSLTALDGRPVSLSDWRGQVVLLNFWTTDCVPCRAEMPEIQAAYQAYRDRNFVVLSINIKEDEGAVAQFAEEFHLTMPVLLDHDGSTARRYRVRGVPTSFLIDPEGVIRRVRVGEMKRAYIDSHLAALGVLAVSDLATPTPAALTPPGTSTDQATAMTTPTPAAPTPPGDSTDQATATTSPTPAAPTPVSGPEGVDLDEIFPPAEGQDLVIKTCLNCHEIFTFGVARYSKARWLDHQAKHKEKFIWLEDEARPSEAEIDTMYKYLVANFDRSRPMSKQLPPGYACGV
jgi:peroxiredoxin